MKRGEHITYRKGKYLVKNEKKIPIEAKGKTPRYV